MPRVLDLLDFDFSCPTCSRHSRPTQFASCTSIIIHYDRIKIVFVALVRTVPHYLNSASIKAIIEKTKSGF